MLACPLEHNNDDSSKWTAPAPCVDRSTDSDDSILDSTLNLTLSSIMHVCDPHTSHISNISLTSIQYTSDDTLDKLDSVE